MSLDVTISDKITIGEFAKTGRGVKARVVTINDARDSHRKY